VETVVAIHQPNFLPWLGWFDKLARADVFVLLDHVQFPRTSRGTYVNRVKLLVGGKDAWATAPIVRASGSVQRIDEVRVDDAQPWREKLLRTVEHNYRRAGSYDEVSPLVREILAQPTDRLAELNERGVRGIADALGLDASKFVRSSTLDASSQATDLLIELTKAVGGTTYLAGNLAGSTYQEDEKFEHAGIELRFQRFEHPRYEQQVEEFVPGLSVVDALMHVGPERTRALLAT
jgi:WbqC-like protein